MTVHLSPCSNFARYTIFTNSNDLAFAAATLFIQIWSLRAAHSLEKAMEINQRKYWSLMTSSRSIDSFFCVIQGVELTVVPSALDAIIRVISNPSIYTNRDKMLVCISNSYQCIDFVVRHHLAVALFATSSARSVLKPSPHDFCRRVFVVLSPRFACRKSQWIVLTRQGNKVSYTRPTGHGYLIFMRLALHVVLSERGCFTFEKRQSYLYHSQLWCCSSQSNGFEQ